MKTCQKKREELGDQWLDFHASRFHPHFVLITAGENDADDMNSVLGNLWESNLSLSEKRITDGKMMKTWYDAICKSIDEFFNELLEHIPGCVIRYTPILMCPWWSQRVRHFARWLDHYVLAVIGKTYNIKELPL